MKYVTAKFKKGAARDPVILLAGLLTVVAGFLTLYETDFWSAQEDLWKPIALVGFLVVIANLIAQSIRPKLVTNLMTDNGNKVLFQPVKKQLFSGWVSKPQREVDKVQIKSAKILSFPGSSSGPALPGAAGMLWVWFELQDRTVIEFNFDDDKAIKDIISFVRTNLPMVELEVDEALKI